MTKFLHCADIHLDSVFQALDGGRNDLRRAELREVFTRIVSLAKTEKVDIVFISGDIFEGENASAESIELIVSEFERASEVKFFISPGNHDPYSQGSQYTLMNLPPNAHIFRKPEIEKVSLEDLKLNVYGAAFVNKTCASSLLNGFVVEKSEFDSICIIHGDIFTPTGPYNSMSQSEIANSGFDYIALGHVHAGGEYKIGQTLCVYPGAPEGRGFDELGDKGVILGRIENHKLDVEFRSTAYRKYLEQEIDVTECETDVEVLEKARATAFEAPLINLYKVILTGEVKGLFDTQILYDAIASDFFFLKIYDNTTQISDGLLNEESLKGIFVGVANKEIQVATDENTRKILNLAKKFGTCALERRQLKI